MRNGCQYSGSGRRILQSPSRSHRGDRAGITGCVPDAHYVSQVVTVMSAWQEAVQTAASHMEGVDTTIYLARCEDVRRATQEYVAAVMKAREERDAAHAVEQGVRRRALKDDDHGDPVVRLLSVT